LRNYLLFRYRILRPIFTFLWNRLKKGHPVEGVNAESARAIKQKVGIPVLCTGGFQRASFVREKLEQGYFDGVTIARALIANNDLAKVWAAGKDQPDRPCTHCNRCLLYAPAYPLGCYETDRYDGADKDARYENMIKEVFSVYDPPQ
jgi:2,4-dienoyl-CoA reductase (NADPH2)